MQCYGRIAAAEVDARVTPGRYVPLVIVLLPFDAGRDECLLGDSRRKPGASSGAIVAVIWRTVFISCHEYLLG
jgi:hypothetical protein